MFHNNKLTTSNKYPKIIRINKKQIIYRHNKSSMYDSILNTTKVVGDGITLFVFFYASLNYLYYRDIIKNYKDKDK